MRPPFSDTAPTATGNPPRAPWSGRSSARPTQTPRVFGGGSFPVWITPKFKVYDSPRAAVVVGALHFLNIDDLSMGIAYAAGTFGSRDDAVTAGVGWAYASNDDNDEGAAMVMIGGERRASRRLK